MKIRVQRRDGRIETISVVGPAKIHHGDGLDHLHSADSLDHYFTPEGYYDGWGKAVAGEPVLGTPEGDAILDDIDRISREHSTRPSFRFHRREKAIRLRSIWSLSNRRHSRTLCRMRMACGRASRKRARGSMTRSPLLTRGA